MSRKWPGNKDLEGNCRHDRQPNPPSAGSAPRASSDRQKTSGELNMGKRNTFRVAVVGHPSAEQWLLAAAFEATRKRNCAYELVTDPKDTSPDILVVDAEDEDALARWRKRDPM